MRTRVKQVKSATLCLRVRSGTKIVVLAAEKNDECECIFEEVEINNKNLASAIESS